MIAYQLMPNSTVRMPVLAAQISAGLPVDLESALERIDANKLLSRNSQDVLLIKVNGDSMEDVPILSGDWVILDRMRSPKPNDIIIARIGGGFTIKRFKLNDNGKNGLYLVPANQKYEVKQITEKDDCEILGVVTFIIHPTV